jgi:phage recombination protein Bet
VNAQTQPKSDGGAVVVFQQPRLPYHDAIKERFGVDRSGWKALVEAIYPSAKTSDAVVMALSYCRARNLDPFKRPVHIVPMWDSKSGGYVETVWPGIAELRTTAFRTGNYAGCDSAEFGPTAKKEFGGRVKVKGEWTDKTITVEFPEWCRITVYRELGGRVCKFVGPKVKWLEAYATIGNSDLPNDMWQTRPEGQIEKCAEAAALRKAFPEELGNDLTAEEMTGRTLADDRVSAERVVNSNDGPPAPSALKTVEPAPQTAAPRDADIELVEAGRDDGRQVEWGENGETPAPSMAPDHDEIPAMLDRRPKATDEYANWRKDAEGALAGCEDAESLFKVHKNIITPAKGKVFPGDWQAVALAYKQAFDRITMAA